MHSLGERRRRVLGKSAIWVVDYKKPAGEPAGKVEVRTFRFS
jgi:hypothetical protein